MVRLRTSFIHVFSSYFHFLSLYCFPAWGLAKSQPACSLASLSVWSQLWRKYSVQWRTHWGSAITYNRVKKICILLYRIFYVLGSYEASCVPKMRYRLSFVWFEGMSETSQCQESTHCHSQLITYWRLVRTPLASLLEALCTVWASVSNMQSLPRTEPFKHMKRLLF